MLARDILEYFPLFQKTEEPSLNKNILHRANDVFKKYMSLNVYLRALSGTSWFLYVIAVLIVASCLYYYFFERRDGRAESERIREIQHLIDRPPPKRRPGAAGREREVLRHVLQEAHSYLYPERDKTTYVVRETRSGTVYARFVDDMEST